MRSVLVPCAHLNNENISGLVSLLIDMQTSAILQTAKSQLIKEVAAFPDEAMKEKALTLLERLRKRSRLLDCYEFGGPCAAQLCCDREVSAASLVVHDGCGAAAAVGQVQLDEYSCSEMKQVVTASDLSELRIRSRHEWEESVLQPFFRFAKSLYIVDYYAGREIARYAESLEWLIAVYRRECPDSPITLFTNARNERERDLTFAWCERVGVHIELRSYNGNSDSSLPHDRFLITQSSGLQIGRGTNLKFGDNVRPTSVHIVKSPGDIISQCYAAASLSLE